MGLLKDKTAKIVKKQTPVTYSTEQLSNINAYFDEEMKIAVQSFIKKDLESIIVAEEIILLG